jgi:XTP/dITP diphosphohydrolase
MKEIILATTNPGKIKELQDILAPTRCISQIEFGIKSIEETGLSFIENALLKARFVSRITGKPSLADDSGLVVAALNGAPGIRSARFAGQVASDADNIARLLEQLKSVPPEKRQAYFYCAIALVRHAEDPIPILAYGQLSGSISSEPIGNHGFGYDPVFYVSSHQCTLAELPSEVKNIISHRARALQQLRDWLMVNDSYAAHQPLSRS